MSRTNPPLRIAAPLLLALLTTGCASSGGEGGEPPPLLVMTYNVRYGTADDGENSWEHRSELALDVVRVDRPDAVGMQELLPFQREAFLAACPDYDVVGRGRDADGGGEQSAIFFRRERLVLLDSGNFWLSETPDVPGSQSWDSSLPRMCTWARFRDLETGRGLHLLNTHFDHRGEVARREGARLIMNRIAALDPPGPVVLTGDLNATPTSPPLHELASLIDAWGTTHPDGMAGGTFHGFDGGTDGRRIDYVLVTPGVRVLDAEVLSMGSDGRYPSDHHPVSARLLIR